MVAIAARTTQMLSLTAAGAWADIGPIFIFFDHRSPIAGSVTCSSLPVGHSSRSLRDDAGSLVPVSESITSRLRLEWFEIDVVRRAGAPRRLGSCLSSSNLGLHPTPSAEPALFLGRVGRLSDPWRLAGMLVKPFVLCYFPMACDVGEHPLWVRILIPSQRSPTYASRTRMVTRTVES